MLAGAIVLLQLGLVVAAITAVALSDIGRPAPRAALPPAEVAVIAADVADVTARLDAWWATEASVLGLRFTSVGGRVTDGDDGLRCDGEPIVIDDDLADNAWAAGCTEGVTIAYDPALFRDNLLVEVVLAHEWGHVVQFHNRKLDVLTVRPGDAPAEGELQADCLAGAWAAANMSAKQHAAAEQATGELGDEWDLDDDDPDGHGTPEERATAFRTGLDDGVGACLPDRFDPR